MHSGNALTYHQHWIPKVRESSSLAFLDSTNGVSSPYTTHHTGIGKQEFEEVMKVQVCTQKTIEYTPWISLWLSCSACCGCTAQSWSNNLCCSCCRCSLHLAQWCWCFPLLSVLFLHFPLILSLLLAHLNTCLDDWPPTAVGCSYSFQAWWIDVACLQISFTDVFEAENRLSCRSGASGELTIQHVLGDSSILHAADVTKPAQAPLGKQSKHAWYSCLSQDILVWEMVLPGDAQNPSEVEQVDSIESVFLGGSTESMPHCHRAACWAHRLNTPSSMCWWSTWSFLRPSLQGKPLLLLPCQSMCWVP